MIMKCAILNNVFITIWFDNYICKASLYQKLINNSVLGTKFIKSLFVQYSLLISLRAQLETCSTGRSGSSMKGLLDFPKEQNFYILYKTNHLMMMNKRNQETAKFEN